MVFTPHPIPLVSHPARLAALAAGEKFFDPGFPCWQGHTSRRYVAGHCKCVACSQALNTGRPVGRPKKPKVPKPRTHKPRLRTPEPRIVSSLPLGVRRLVRNEERFSYAYRDRSDYLDQLINAPVQHAVQEHAASDEKRKGHGPGAHHRFKNIGTPLR